MKTKVLTAILLLCFLQANAKRNVPEKDTVYLPEQKNNIFYREDTVTVIPAKEISTLKIIYINKDITTHFVALEDITYTDLSSQDIVQDLPVPNVLRVKPIEEGASGVLTIVSEKYFVQYMLIYTTDLKKVVSRYSIPYYDLKSFMNSERKLTKSEMTDYCQRMFISKNKYYDITRREKHLRLTVNNIYTLENYFFIDLTLYNSTNIQVDIDKIRFKIEDKRQIKATNFQSIEIFPEMELYPKKTFKKNWRNIYVFEKFTFPEEKVVCIEVTEKQISGRAIKVYINYIDILKADTFVR